MNSRCPHCASIFDIPLEAFSAADGVVRCGGCMQLFDANQNRYDSDPDEASDVVNDTEQEFPTFETEDSKVGFDTTSIAANNEEATDDETSDDESNHSEAQESDLAQDHQPDKVSLQNYVSDKLLEDDLSNDLDNSLDNDPIEALSEEAEPSASAKPVKEVPLTSNDSTEPKATDEPAQTDEVVDLIETDNFELPQDSQSFEINPEKNQFDTNFNDNFKWQPPVEHHEVNSKSLLRTISFSLVASLLGLALGLQWLLAYSTAPSSNSSWFSQAKQRVCLLVPCDIHSKNNPALNYQSLDLLVQSHPTETDALILKTTLLNSSNRILPYPRLAIEFSSMNNQITAARIFSPDDYLNSSLLATVASGLAVNQPIDIELELVDPGEDAVNYSLHFLNPES